VFEDGVQKEVTFFNRTNLLDRPGALLDTSASIDASCRPPRKRPSASPGVCAQDLAGSSISIAAWSCPELL
jgi:hypothetical protein